MKEEKLNLSLKKIENLHVNLVSSIVECFNRAREEKANTLIQDYPEEYILYTDRDYVDNGICQMCVRSDDIFDDDLAYDDAKEHLLKDIKSGNGEFLSEVLMYDNKFITILTELLENVK